jgi:DNA repair protein RecO (recombination protein O)
MTSHPRRVLLAPGYILHHRPYRDTSRILEVLVRDHGRLTLFARGVRGPKPRFGGVLQPFDLLLLSFQLGRGEAGQLTGAESAESAPPLPAGSLMAGFYLNELLLKLTTRHDPMVEVFEEYRRALTGLRARRGADEHAGAGAGEGAAGGVGERAGRGVESVLRLFEKRLLEAVGYGVDLTAEARTGKAIEAAGFYRYQASQGLIPAREGDADAVAGSSLLALAREELGEGRILEDVRKVLKAALAERLEGKELATRRVARAVASRGGSRT